MRSTKKTNAKTERNTLRNIQQIANKRAVSTSAKPPTDGITSSAEKLRADLDRIETHVRIVASENHIHASDILAEIRKRVEP